MTDKEFKDKIYELLPSAKTGKISHKEWEKNKYKVFALIINEISKRKGENDNGHGNRS